MICLSAWSVLSAAAECFVPDRRDHNQVARGNNRLWLGVETGKVNALGHRQLLAQILEPLLIRAFTNNQKSHVTGALWQGLKEVIYPFLGR